MKLERKDLKALVLTIWIVAIIDVIMYFAALPFIVNAYLDRQPVYSIGQAQDYIAHKGLYGHVIVVEGTVADVFPSVMGRPQDFIITTGYNQEYGIATGRNILVYGTGRLNCIPVTGTVKKIAGSWNPTDAYGMNNQFYGVWVLDGC